MTPEEMTSFAFAEFPALAVAGVRCVAARPGEAEAVWSYDEAQLRPGGYISGPTQFMVADTCLWFAVFTLIGLEPMAVTSDLQMTFLRPALGDDLHGLATVVSQSRRRIHGTVRLWVGEDRDRLVAHATGTYAVPQG